MMGSEPLRRLMGWLGSVKSYRAERMDGAADWASLGKSRPPTVGGETEGEIEGRLLSVAVEELRCKEIEPFTLVPSRKSEESIGGG